MLRQLRLHFSARKGCVLVLIMASQLPLLSQASLSFAVQGSMPLPAWRHPVQMPPLFSCCPSESARGHLFHIPGIGTCRHYDWGLRAIKSVLVVAGSLLRAQEGQVESDVLFRALRDFNIPKILSQDMVIFTGLLQDLFPGVNPPRKRDIEFEKVGCLDEQPTACT